MGKDFGPWIQHDGRGYPAPEGAMLVVRYACGAEMVIWMQCVDFPMPDAFIWASLHKGDWDKRIIAYRLLRSQALLDLVEIAANPAPLPERVYA